MKITPITILPGDDRGITAEYLHERSGNHLIIFRKAGSVSGRHYHKGIAANKAPEIFILLSGSMTLNWRKVSESEIHTEELRAPVQLEIPPYTWHEFIMKTDCTAIELNSIADHIKDTFRVE